MCGIEGTLRLKGPEMDNKFFVEMSVYVHYTNETLLKQSQGIRNEYLLASLPNITVRDSSYSWMTSSASSSSTTFRRQRRA